jgi:hypothetical protein
MHVYSNDPCGILLFQWILHRLVVIVSIFLETFMVFSEEKWHITKLNSHKNITLCFIWSRVGSWDILWAFVLLSLCWVFLASPFWALPTQPWLCTSSYFVYSLTPQPSLTPVGSLRLGLETFDTIFASGWEFNRPLSRTWS